jgi:cyanophycinase-like exopeptidase
MGSQEGFDYYLACGSQDAVTINHQFGILLIGGGEEDKSGEHEATQWFLQRLKGGKYLVLRTGGIGGQADWICRHYRDWIHSAAELSIDSRAGANSPQVIEYITEADGLFIAGGDQKAYQEYWEGTKTEDALNYAINQKKIPIAGTSAGMAILGGYYYCPEHQGVLSSEILDDPFHYNSQTIYKSDFLQFPYLQQVITDTHLDRMNRYNPEARYGRLFGLLAKIVDEKHQQPKKYAIGLEEGAFVAIDEQGIAQVFGNGTKIGQDAYFLQTNGNYPEQIEPGWPLIWHNEGKAVKVYQISGTREGSGSFDLKDWSTASGGQWQYWFTLGGKSGFRKVRI